MGTLWRDLRYGFRTLVKNPGFAVVAVLTLALGIGANTAIFSVLNAVVLHPLPFPHPDRLVLVWMTDKNRDLDRAVSPPPDFLDWRDQNHVFEELSAWRTWFFNLTGANDPEQVWGVRASANFFKLLGARAALGRTFLPDEDQPGHDQEVIISHNLWERRFGGDPNLIGKTIAIDEKPFTVVGVLPAGFTLFGTTRQFDLWMPLAFEPGDLRRDNPSLVVFGRLKPGVTLAGAQAEMNAITRRLEEEYPQTNKGVGARVVLLQKDIVATLTPALELLFACVSFVLLIACSNVANLLLARAAGRQKEIAVRVAMGAGRLRLVRQLLTESTLLATLGGAVGVLLAFGMLRLLPVLVPPTSGFGEIPHRDWIGLDLPVLLFALGVSVLAGIVFGLAPAFQFLKTDLSDTLKEGERGSTGGRRSRRMRSALLVSEVALSLVLLVGAGLLIRSFRNLLAMDLGLQPQNVLTMQVWLPESRYPTGPAIASFYQAALERIRRVPGVDSASAINFLPLSGWTDLCNFSIEGRPEPPSGQKFNAHYRVIGLDYFRTMGIPLKQGRDLTEADGDRAPGVVLINEALVQRYWPNENPIGRRIRLNFPPTKTPWRPLATDAWFTIVGIVGDVKEWAFGNRKFGQVYLSHLQNPSRLMRLAIRTSSDPQSIVSAVRQQLLVVDKDQPVTEIKTMEQFLAESVSTRHLNMVVLSFFAAFALILSAIGVYGVISYSVAERTHDIGIRMALGARPGDVLKLVVGEGLRLALLGVAIGLVASFFLARLLEAELFGVKATDPLTLLSVALLLTGVALLACYVPARRATKVDPISALRYE
jgi:predicted permease